MIDILTGEKGNAAHADVAALASALTLIRACLHKQIKLHKARAICHTLTHSIERTLDRAESLQKLANAHSAHAENDLNGKASEAEKRLHLLQAKRDRIRLVCAGLYDDIQLLQSEANHGALYTTVKNTQQDVSNLQIKCDEIEMNNHDLHENIVAYRKTIEEFHASRSRSKNEKLPRKKLIAAQGEIAELEDIICALQQKHKARRDAIFKRGIRTADLKEQLLKTGREVRELKLMRDRILQVKTPRPAWRPAGNVLGKIDLKKFINAKHDALMHPFTANGDKDNAELAPTIDNVDTLCELVEEAYHGANSGVEMYIPIRLRNLFDEADQLHVKLVNIIRDHGTDLPPHFDKVSHAVACGSKLTS